MSPLYAPTRTPLPTGFMPPTTGWQQPSNMVSSVATAVTSGLLTVVPFDVGATKFYSGLGVGVIAAQVAGTTTTTLGVYPDNGSGGLPNFVGGPITSGTIVLTVTGNIKATTTFSLTANRYWLAFLYVASVAPTTAATINSLNGAAPALWITSGLTIGTIARGLSATAQTALPTTQIALSTIGNSTSVTVAAQAT